MHDSHVHNLRGNVSKSPEINLQNGEVVHCTLHHSVIVSDHLDPPFAHLHNNKRSYLQLESILHSRVGSWDLVVCLELLRWNSLEHLNYTPYGALTECLESFQLGHVAHNYNHNYLLLRLQLQELNSGEPVSKRIPYEHQVLVCLVLHHYCICLRFDPIFNPKPPESS